LSPQVFSQAVAALPLVSIDVYALDGDGRLLLGRRNNRPAQGAWFTPGGRIRKGETLPQAWVRVWREELGWSGEVVPAGRLLGAWDHIYPDSAFDAGIPTHYVNLAYAVDLPEGAFLRLPQGPHAQHAAWRWLPLAEVATADGVHDYVRTTVRDEWGSGG
jgi:colanic acid biosynthesis protein WcaH